MTQPTHDDCWDVDRDVTLAELGRWCLATREVDRLFVVARPDNDAPGNLAEPRVERKVSEIFASRILKTAWVRAWAGTELFRNRAARVWTIAFDETVLVQMIAVQNLLRRWRHSEDPPLPEDLCLYRLGDPLPTLVSVTHDGEAWLFDPAAEGASFARRAELPLPRDLIPRPADFLRP